MSAALGASQLGRIEKFLARRGAVAEMYTERLRQYDWVRTPIVRPHVRMSWFVYVVTLADGLDRDPVIAAMESRGIPVRGYFPPVHLQPYIRQECGSGWDNLPVTESVSRRTIALPFHNKLTEAEIDQVVSALRESVENVHDRAR
jgi:perosamine synthetase